MTSDAYVNLLYEGSPNLAMTVEAASMHHYMHNGGVRLTFSVDDCGVGSARISERGRRVIHLPIPDTCRPQLGEISTVRISSDNLIDSSITTDSRAMSVIGINIGFVSTPSALERAEMLERELVPGLGFKRIPDGIRPVSNTVLRVSPNPVDFCTEERRSVEVTWDMSAANPAALQIWLEEPRGQSKLWISTGHQIGKKKSGDWVVEGMKFIAVDATRGKVLDIAEVLAVECK
jgi:hypothetical protein